MLLTLEYTDSKEDFVTSMEESHVTELWMCGRIGSDMGLTDHQPL
jgi:hypothetical protein